MITIEREREMMKKKKTRLKRERNGDVGFGFLERESCDTCGRRSLWFSLFVIIFVFFFNGLTFYSCNSNNI